MIKHPFADVEDKLAGKYYKLRLAALQDAIDEFDTQLEETPRDNSRDKWVLLLLLLNTSFFRRTYITKQDINSIQFLVEQAHKNGASYLGTRAYSQVKDDPAYSQVLAQADVFSDYFLNQYFSRIQEEKMLRQVDALLAQGASVDKISVALQTSLENQKGDSNYWGVIANALITLHFHWALFTATSLSDLSDNGRPSQSGGRVVFNAVLDGRTTRLCSSLDGTTWSARALKEQAQRELLSPPSVLAFTHKFYDPSLPFSDQNDGRIPTPALHFNCRSALLPIL
jgi:hypothetical protein